MGTPVPTSLTIDEQIRNLHVEYREARDASPLGTSIVAIRVGDVVEQYTGKRYIQSLDQLPDAIAAEAIRRLREVLAEARARSAFGGVTEYYRAPDNYQFDTHGILRPWVNPPSVYPGNYFFKSNPKPTTTITKPKPIRSAPAAGDDALPNLDLSPHVQADFDIDLRLHAAAIKHIGELIHRANIAAGWWTNRVTGEPKPRNVGEMLALVHSEISEALEHHRKGTMDDHLPDRPGIEVELADAMIRIWDLATALRLDLAGAIVDKAVYNTKRADHKPEARSAAGGKAF